MRKFGAERKTPKSAAPPGAGTAAEEDGMAAWEKHRRAFSMGWRRAAARGGRRRRPLTTVEETSEYSFQRPDEFDATDEDVVCRTMAPDLYHGRVF
jgi:hypothetical protein